MTVRVDLATRGVGPCAAVDLRHDVHVHSTFSDDARSTLAENATAGSAAGLHLLVFVEHVRRSTTWVPALASAVAALHVDAPMEIRSGVEAKILDRTGHLDLPPDADLVDHVLIADHQFPTTAGPRHPAEVRDLLDRGRISPADAVECLLEATVAALGRCRRPVLAHLFSILPKIGLSEDDVPDRLLVPLATAAARVDAVLDLNEKWGCPSPRVVRLFLGAGVTVEPGSDSHHCRDVGRFVRVRRVLAEAAALP